MSNKTSKAVIPVAGLGTRFLPVTKVVPKELFPIVDRPAIHYVVEEAVRAGITEIILINHPNKTLIEDYFRNDTQYDRLLAEKGKGSLLKDVVELNNKIKVTTVYQKEALGLGHAVLQAKEAVGNDWFMLILPDMLIDAEPGCCEQLVKVWQETGKAVIATEHAPRDMISSYGIIATESCHCEGVSPKQSPAYSARKLHKVSHLVEKPKLEDAPSDLSIVGRYLLPPSIFSYIENTKPGAIGEIQITDALCELAKKESLFAYEFTGKLHDTGDKQGYLSANAYYTGKH